MSFCPSCGKETTELYHGLCKTCFVKRYLIVEPPKEIKVRICPECGKSIYEEPKITASLDWYELDIIYRENEAEITVRGEIEGIPIEKEFTIPLKKEFKKCERCIKIQQENYVVKIQLRHDTPTDMDKYYKYHSMLEKIADWKKELKEGTDFFFIDKKTPQQILKQFKKSGYKITPSYTFKGIKHGKKKIQYTYCIRI